MLIIFLLISVAGCAQRNLVVDLRNQQWYADYTDTVPLLFKFTENDTIINDTMGTIKYLIKENQRLYDLLERKDKMFIDLSTTISSLMMYIPKREQYFTL